MIVTAKSQHLHLLVIQLLDWFTWRVIDCCGFLRIIEGFATIGSKVANVNAFGYTYQACVDAFCR